jgi:hypothetical protein
MAEGLPLDAAKPIPKMEKISDALESTERIYTLSQEKVAEPI